MKTTGIIFIVFFTITACLLLIIPLTSHKTVMSEQFGSEFSNTTQNSTTFSTNVVNTTINTTEEVTTNRTLPNRQMESIMDLNNTQSSQWSASPGAFESTFTTQVNLTYSPVAHNIPLVKHGYHSSAPREVIRLEDDIMLSYNLSTEMNQYN